MHAFLKGLLALALASTLTAITATGSANAQAAKSAPAPIWNKIAIPEQAPVAYDGYAKLKDKSVKLWYSDTGGKGEVIVLLHPWSQSGLIWKYQQPVFAAAGYRVIMPSRRGSYKSLPGTTENPGTAAGDILALVDSLKIKKFHLVGCAAGGVTALAFAINNPERLSSLTLCNSILLVDEPEWRDMFSHLTLAKIGDESKSPPIEWMELSASYRAGNPEGAKIWADMEKVSRPNGLYNGQAWGAKVNWETMGKMNVPTLLTTGVADLSAPPSLQRLHAQHLPNAELKIVTEAAHALYWEQPEIFNKMILDWVGAHKEPAKP
jgi:pimeloyl-ACP methyl ester carboxylesterase